MNDLISRQDAIDALCKACSIESDYHKCEGYNPNSQWCEEVTALRGVLSAQPEIIRCKDCKFWTHIKRTNRYWCKTDNGLYDLNPSPNDYCSRAERRTDETD